MRGAAQEKRGPGLNRRKVGKGGEDLAMRYLVRKGYDEVERNYRTPYGEIDLVVSHGAPGRRALVFVEVKLRRGTGFGDPLEAVTPRKRARLRRAAEQYLALMDELPGQNGGPDGGFDEVRFDAVGILLPGRGRKPEIRHVEDAF